MVSSYGYVSMYEANQIQDKNSPWVTATYAPHQIRESRSLFSAETNKYSTGGLKLDVFFNYIGL